ARKNGPIKRDVGNKGAMGFNFTSRFEFTNDASEAWGSDEYEGVPCSCACCEFRQYIMGQYLINGNRLEMFFNPDTFVEDSVVLVDGGLVPGYGHRNQSGDPSTCVYSNPDRATGCNYRMFDEPGWSVNWGDTLRIELTFKQTIIDVCLT